MNGMFEIILLVTLLLIIFSIAMSSIIIGISPMPSSKKVIAAIESYVRLSNETTIIDLGSGFGSLAIALASRFPNKKVIGYELSFFPWFVSIILKHLLGVKNVDFYRKNYLKLSFQKGCYVSYLFPKGMQLLEDKLKNEQDVEDGIVIISSTFAFRNTKPLRQMRVDDIYRTPIYYYRFN